MSDEKHRVCPVEKAGGLDNAFRRFIQNPNRLLRPYVREGMRVLDFGCGPGFFSLELARLVGPSGRVFAADLQEGMLERLRGKLRGSELEPRVVLHQTRQEAIGLAERVDFALAFYVLHELPDRRAFFAEVRTLLCPEGRLLAVEPPIHVSRRAFEATLGEARDAGLAVAERPRIRFSKAALLKSA